MPFYMPMAVLSTASDTTHKWLVISGDRRLSSAMNYQLLFKGREIVEIYPDSLDSLLEQAKGVWEGIFCLAHGSRTRLGFPRPITYKDVARVPADRWPRAQQLLMGSCYGTENGIAGKMAEKMRCPVTYSSGRVQQDILSVEQDDGSLSFFRIDFLTRSTQDLERYDPCTEKMAPTYSYENAVAHLSILADSHDVVAGLIYGSVLVRGPERLRDRTRGLAYLEQAFYHPLYFPGQACLELALDSCIRGDFTTSREYLEFLPARSTAKVIEYCQNYGIRCEELKPPTRTSDPCTVS